MTKEELKMTSKEALERLEDVLTWNSDIDIDKDLYNLWVNLVCRTIEKDLEILQILKKKMSIETDYYDDDNMCREYEYIACNGMDLCIENEEEFNKIKEWLTHEDK